MTYSTQGLGGLTSDYYRDSPLKMRLLTRLRPSYSPLAEILAYVTSGSAVFDIDCGSGLLLMALAALDDSITGIGVDPSSEAIQRVNRAASRLKRVKSGGVQFIVGDTTDHWPAGPFDVVTMIDVMHHLAPTWQQSFFLKAAERVKPGGILIYKDMCSRPMWRAWANRGTDLLSSKQWIHYVPIRQIECRASKHE
jgi:2-polyprenyl-3-methyl-5-hydroxy-6-metoxy-1,4-benzoquinol methylase